MSNNMILNAHDNEVSNMGLATRAGLAPEASSPHTKGKPTPVPHGNRLPIDCTDKFEILQAKRVNVLNNLQDARWYRESKMC